MVVSRPEGAREGPSSGGDYSPMILLNHRKWRSHSTIL